MTDDTGFGEWPLHDAVLHELSFNWKERRCVVTLEAFVRGLDQDAELYHIRFDDVSDLRIPIQEPWGKQAESYVNTQRQEGDRFVFELHSGDEIEVRAGKASLSRKGP